MARARHAPALVALVLFCFYSQSNARHPIHHLHDQSIELPTNSAAARGGGGGLVRGGGGGLARGGGGGLVWVVQLSDLHFSSYRPLRALSFKKLLPPLLALIKPSLVLITGDLTDGKSKDLATMRQDESEWVQYREVIDWVISQSGLPEHAFFDIRGNHDKFGVPEVGGSFDYFSKYSITAQQNRSNSVQSVTLVAVVQIHVRGGSNRYSENISMGLKKPTEPMSSCKLCKRWLRKALLVACLGVAYLHAQYMWAIVGAYGMSTMLISPGFAWSVPILLVAAVLQTASVESSCFK